jgi:hypothetical protein
MKQSFYLPRRTRSTQRNFSFAQRSNITNLSVVKIANQILASPRDSRVGLKAWPSLRARCSGGSPKRMGRQNGEELPGASVLSTLVAARQLVLFSLDSMGYGRCIQVGRRFHSI